MRRPPSVCLALMTAFLCTPAQTRTADPEEAAVLLIGNIRPTARSIVCALRPPRNSIAMISGGNGITEAEREVPADLTGAQSVSFVLPPNVPMPKGDPGFSTVTKTR